MIYIVIPTPIEYDEDEHECPHNSGVFTTLNWAVDYINKLQISHAKIEEWDAVNNKLVSEYPFFFGKEGKRCVY